MTAPRISLWLVGFGLLAVHAVTAPAMLSQARSRPTPAQSRSRPPTTQPPAPVTAVTGRVVTGEMADPVANARIVISGERSSDPVVVMTNDEGTFRAQVAGARVSLAVTKTGFAPARQTVVAGQETVVQLLRGAVIAGRVLDETGTPAINLRVSAEQISGTSASTVGVAVTDDRGEYRIGGLPAGRYRAMTSIPPTNRQDRRIFYRSTLEAAEAEFLDVSAGEERANVDIALPINISSMSLDPGGNYGRAMISDVVAGRPSVSEEARVRGRVVGPTRSPIPNATVRINGGRFFRTVLSGPDGEFAFDELPAGGVGIEAMKAGFSSNGGGGSERRGFVSMELKAGDDRSDVELVLVPWSTVTGRVVDEYGDPVQGARLQLMRVRHERGRQRLVAAGAGVRSTNDLGIYRLWDVTPGRYLVSATVGEVQSAELPGYGRSYYPGVADPAASQYVIVPASGEVTGIDITLVRQETFKISGRLLDASGQPTGAGSLTLWPSVDSPSALGIPTGARIEGDGTFEFANVTPGPYVVQTTGGSRSASEPEFAAIAVNVANQDVTGLLLRRSSGSQVSGRVIANPSSPDFQTLGRIEITTVAADVDLSPTNNLASARPDRDMQFALRGLNGPRRLVVRGVPPGWSLDRITMSGLDVTDRVINFGRPDSAAEDVEIELVNHASRVQGTVTDRNGRGLVRTAVVLFSPDRERWYAGSRFVRLAMTTPEGSYRLDGLPPGTYYAAAIVQPPGDASTTDPATLEALLPQAQSVMVFMDQTTTVNLRIER